MDDYKNKNFINQLIKAADKGKVILFVGAGVSKLCGLPLWGELAESLLKEAAQDSKNKFTFSDLNLLLNSVKDPRELITIAMNIFGPDEFKNKKLKEKLSLPNNRFLSKEQINNKNKISRLILNLGDKIITTNVDAILDEQLNDTSSVFYEIKNFDFNNQFDHKIIFHIHGSINRVDSMIFSTSDYLKRYSDKAFRDKIKTLFNKLDDESIVIFIGYSLNDLQLLDLIVDPREEVTEERLKKVYYLKGYYSHEKFIFNAEKEYFKTYGINLLSYSMDRNGYNNLVDVLSFLNNEVKTNSLKKKNYMNDLINLLSKKPKNDDFFKFLKFSSYIDLNQKFVFDEILKSKYLYNWVDLLFAHKEFFKLYFSPKSLKAKKNEKIDGIKFLLQLDFSKILNKKPFKKYIIDLINYININSTLFENESILNPLCYFLIRNKNFLCLEKTYNFISSYQQKYGNYYLLFFLGCRNNALNQIGKKSLQRYINFSLDNLEKSHRNIDEFGNFFDNNLKTISETIPLETINKVLQVFKSDIEDKNNYLIGKPFEQYMNQSSYYEPFEIACKILAFCLIKLNDKQLKVLFYRFDKKTHKFYKQLNIFICNIRFNLINSELLFTSNSYRNTFELFSELYLLLKTHIFELDGNLVNQIVDYIRTIKFNGLDIYTLVAKYYLINLLKENFSFSNNDEFLRFSNEINLSVANKENVIFGLPSAENLSNKMFLFKRNPKKNSITFLRNLDNDSFFTQLREINPDILNYEENDEINKNFIKRISDNGFFNYLNSKNPFASLNFEFTKMFVTSFSSSEIICSDDLILNLINFINSFDGNNKKQLKEISVFVIHIIFSRLTERGNQIKESINSFLDDELFIDDEMWEIKTYSNYKDINNLFSNGPFLWKMLLILTSSEQRFEKLILKHFSNFPTINREQISKAALCANFNQIWLINKNYINNNFLNLFPNNEFILEYSFLGFSVSPFYNCDFVDLLFKNNILPKLLNSECFVYSKTSFVEFVYILFLEENTETEVLKCALDSDKHCYSLNNLFKKYLTKNIKYIPKKILETFFKLIGSTDFDRSDICGVNLMSANFEEIDEDLLSSTITKLLSNKNSGALINEFKHVYKNCCINISLKEEILSTFILKIEYLDCYIEDINSLIHEISWSSEEKKKRLINKISKIAPGILKLN